MTVGQLLLGFLAIIVLLAVVGFRMKKKRGGDPDETEKAQEKVLENVTDLNDRFNRARYMDQDGK